MNKTLRCALLAALAAAPLTAQAGPHDAAIHEIVDQQVRTWLNSPVVVESVKAQNRKNSGLSQSDIDSLDKKWRAETRSSSRPLIDDVLGNPLSRHLRVVKESGAGLFTEIFVMDARGLNVGQSDVTSDYWQGDEAKWQRTFGAGGNAVFIDDVEFDESTQQYQVQTSIAITDPGSNEVIGAVTIGMNVELLE